MNIIEILKRSINEGKLIEKDYPDLGNIIILKNYLQLYLDFIIVNNIDLPTANILKKFLGNYPKSIIVEAGDKTISKIFITSEFLKDSLLSVYPKFGTIKGKFYPLITGDLDKLFEDYAKKIGYSIDTHKEVLEIVQWAKDKELLNIGIEKFILSYYWESLKELREKDNVTSNMIADDF